MIAIELAREVVAKCKNKDCQFTNCVIAKELLRVFALLEETSRDLNADCDEWRARAICAGWKYPGEKHETNKPE